LGYCTPPSNTSNLYLSYDDAASSASITLVKHFFQTEQISKITSDLGRSWEFLNYETFTSTDNNIDDFTPFHISMGLLESEINSSSKGYELGIHLFSDELNNSSRDPMVLTLLIDTSGSMEDFNTKEPEGAITLMALLQYGLTTLSENLQNGDLINLVTFSTSANILLEAHKIESSESIQTFVETVGHLNSGGSTNLDKGIQKAYEVALRTFDQERQNRLVILTDAYANSGEIDANIISKNTKINNAEGIYFSGLGFGEHFNEAFLNTLTEEGKGAYFSIITKSDAKKAFDTRLQSLLNVAARDVQFLVEYPSVLQHTMSAAEEHSTQQSDVSKTNFSYNSDQFFYENFITDERNTSSLQEMNITFTINYKEPISYEKKEIILQKSFQSLLEKESENIKDARLISTLAFLIRKEITCKEGRTLLEKTISSSRIAQEYRGYIEQFCSYIEEQEKSKLTEEKIPITIL
jgi:Ca-activated chloride channel homolog